MGCVVHGHHLVRALDEVLTQMGNREPDWVAGGLDHAGGDEAGTVDAGLLG